MVGSMFVVVALASIPTPGVKYGTPAQQERLQRALDKVPPCLKSCGEKVLVEVGDFNDEDPKFPNAIYGEDRKGRPVIIVNPALASNTAKTEHREARAYCETFKKMHTLLSDTDAVLLHEFTHNWEYGCGNEKVMKSFLKIRYKSLKQKFLKDPTQKQILSEFAQLRAKKKKMPRDEYWQKVCDLQDRYEKVVEKYKVPSRHRGDTHALDDGGEYLAIAVETMVHEKDAFCSGYSSEEQAWLRDHFAGCVPVPSCGAGASQGNGGEFLSK